MADAARVVEGIRNFLHCGHQTALETLRALAQEYSDACHEINRRLARCEEFLRQGMRGEAIHFADAQPNLLDVLAVLDFPERHEWEQAVAHYGLPAPPVFRMDTATALNQAYAQVAPLDELLKRHRLLALGRAGLGERLAVLRQLAEVDPGNSVWVQDIGALEKVRVGQIRGEVEQLQRHPAALPPGHLDLLYNEVQVTSWKTSLPADLLATIHEMYSAVRNARLLEEAEQLAWKLSAAHAERNEPLARMLAGDWQELTRQVRLSPEGPLAQRSAQALEWLARLDRQQARAREHQEAVDKLQRALADPATHVDDLEDLYEVVAGSKEGVPGHVEAEYRRRARCIEVSRVRRERIVLVAMFVVGASALAAFLYYVTHMH
jgi:hypothetical protein